MQYRSKLRRHFFQVAAVLATWPAASSLSAGVAPTGEIKAVFPENKPQALMGFSVAVDEGIAVAGAIGDIFFGAPSTHNGAGYVYVQNGGKWNFAAKLIPAVGADNASAGWSVDLSGDVVVMGLPYTSAGGVASAGAAFVFVKPAGGWAGNLAPAARLTASDRAVDDNFGYNVAIDGDAIAIGGQGHKIGALAEAGQVYVFTKPAGGWAGNLTETAKLSASDAAESDGLGFSVAIDGDVVVASAADDDLRFPDQGSVYAFVKPAGGWVGSLTESAKLGVSGGAQGDGLSFVAISGNTVAATAAYANQGDKKKVGATYIFERPAGGWSGEITQSATIIPEDPIEEGAFGFSVAISADIVALGHYFSNGNRAFVLQRPSDGWPAETKVKSFVASDTQTDDGFGNSIALSGKTLVVGAPGVSTDFNQAVGALYAYTLEPDSDNDGVADDEDGCPDDANKTEPGVCGCGRDDSDADDDGDGISGCLDNCPDVANADQADEDGDGIGDACAPGPAGQACCGGAAPLATPILLMALRRRRIHQKVSSLRPLRAG